MPSKSSGRQDGHACKNIGRGFAGSAALEPPEGVHIEIAAALVADARIAAGEEEKRRHPLLVPGVHQHFQVRASALDPDGVGVVDEEGLPSKVRKSFENAASRFQNAFDARRR